MGASPECKPGVCVRTETEPAGRLGELIAEVCDRTAENAHVLFEPEAVGRIWLDGRTGKGL